jgi:hypothetical protein
MKHTTINPAIKWIKREIDENTYYDEVVYPMCIPHGYELCSQPTPDGWPYELVPIPEVEVPRERRSFWRRLWERK